MYAKNDFKVNSNVVKTSSNHDDISNANGTNKKPNWLHLAFDVGDTRPLVHYNELGPPVAIDYDNENDRDSYSSQVYTRDKIVSTKTKIAIKDSEKD